MPRSDFCFKDEWLVGLLHGRSGVTDERLEEWREEQAPFLSQKLIDAGILTFPEIAEIKRRLSHDYASTRSQTNECRRRSIRRLQPRAATHMAVRRRLRHWFMRSILVT